MRFIQLLAIISLTIATTLLSCKKEEVITEPVINLQFEHEVDSEKLQFDTINYTNSSNNRYSVSTLQYFISDFVFLRKNDTKISFDTVIYVDVRDGIGLELTGLQLPVGEYTNLLFTFGLNEKKNISGSFPNPPENNMEWPAPMGGGYHYMKLEGKFDSISIVKNYQAHTGRLMSTPHFVDIKLEFKNSISLVNGDNMNLPLVMNINKWWDSPNNLDLNIMSSVMGNQEIQNDLMENGAKVFYIGEIW